MYPAKSNRFLSLNSVLTASWKPGLALWALAGLVISQQVEVAAASRGAAKPPVKVFILAGQSNMEGYGGIKTTDEPGDHPTREGLLKKNTMADGSFVQRNHVFIDYPGRHITPRTTPALAEAARVSLNARGDGQTVQVEEL